jgi:hypothetical protein
VDGYGGRWPSAGLLGTALHNPDPPVEVGVRKSKQAGQLIVGACDLVPQDSFQAIDSREALCEQLDIRAKPFRDDVEVSASLEGRRIDVLPQIGVTLVDLTEALIDLVEPLVDLHETLVDLVEPLIDLVEPSANVVQSVVDVLTERIEDSTQRIEGFLKLGIHGVILLQSKEVR